MKNKTLKPTTLFLLSIFSFSFAQETFQISGTVKEDNGNLLGFANVLLLRATDSVLVKGAISDDNGSYTLQNIASGNYIVKSTMVGYQTAFSNVFSLSSDYAVPALTLVLGESLDEVVVEAAKPLFQQKVDRMVINVESSIVSSGGTALEILERSPGIVVNRQNNSISLVGKSGVIVMINGKRSFMPENALIQLLEGMSADNIESIELITTPPANFDAEGNAGYINVVLKKRTDLGLNGTYSLSYGYGKGDVSNDNFNFNYRKNKLNVYGSYSFSIDTRDQIFKTSREYTDESDLISNKTVTERDPRQRNHNIRLGLDFQASDKTIVGVLLTGFDNRWSMNAFNLNTNSVNGLTTSIVELDNAEINHLKHYGGNFNIKHNFTENEFISFDVDYINYKFNNPTDYENSFYDENETLTSEELLISRKETPLDTWVGKLDYSKKINDKLKLEFGVKSIRNHFENDVSVENFENGLWVIDPTLTNISILDETIYAGYTALDYKISEKTSFKAGLRYEHTDTFLETSNEGAVVDRNYGEWFPSVFLSRQFNDNLGMNISYSRRITRPSFSQLAPFVIFIDPNTFVSGNASIQPSISNTFSFGTNFKSYFLSIQYTNEDESIVRFQETLDEETGRLIFESSNLDYTRSFAFTVGIPVKLFNWWRTQNNINIVSQKIRTFYNEEPIILKTGNFSFNSTHSFKISNNYSFELSGFYNEPGLFGAARVEPIYGMNFGMQQKLGEKWGTLKFSINDLLDSIIFKAGTDLPDQNIKTANSFDFSNRTFMLTYSRTFGNSKLKSARDREIGSEEERRRVN